NGGACDATDHCSGTANACVDEFQPSTVTCRASAGQCDVGEQYSGITGTCPADGFALPTTTCVGTSKGGARGATDHRRGTANACGDEFQPSAVTCRASAGQCDVAEQCTGLTGTWPADGFALPTPTGLRTSNGGACDATDHCSGTANTCVDEF